jgi:chemotaxis signal transduction protein
MTPAAAGREVRALVVERDAVPAALLIDEVLGLEPVEGVVPPEDSHDMIAGHLAREGGAVTLLDVRVVLAAMAAEAEMPHEGSPR